VQALVGKTGKEGLKRRCLGLEPHMVKHAEAARAKVLFNQYELDEIRDVSAGAATFYLWVRKIKLFGEMNNMNGIFLRTQQ
jgi:hypothetical protein